MKGASLIERFLEKTAMNEYGCLEWIGNRDRLGYGHFYIGGHKTELAHRWYYKFCFGEIPEGLELDHRCRNKPCVIHTDAVSHIENVQRAWRDSFHCRNGHYYGADSENLYINPQGYRVCKKCSNKSRDLWYLKKKGHIAVHR